MQETDLRMNDIGCMIKSRYRLILCFFLISTLIAFFYDLLTPRYYESEATIRISQSIRYTNSFLAGAQFSNNNRQLIDTYAELLQSRAIVGTVIEKTKSRLTYEELGKLITVQHEKDSEMLSIRVLAFSPEEARDVVSLLVTELTGRIAIERTVLQQSLRARLQEANDEREKAEKALVQYKQESNSTYSAAEPPAGKTMNPEQESRLIHLAQNVTIAQITCELLAREYAEARVSDVIQPVAVQVIDAPTLPEKPLEQRGKSRRIIIAAILGLVSGIMLALFLESLKRISKNTVKSKY